MDYTKNKITEDQNNKITTDDQNNKIITDYQNNQTANYWQTQAILVMNNLNINEKNNNLFPVKYSISGAKINTYKTNNFELMEDLSI
jgi:hypothetical protein